MGVLQREGAQEEGTDHQTGREQHQEGAGGDGPASEEVDMQKGLISLLLTRPSYGPPDSPAVRRLVDYLVFPCCADNDLTRTSSAPTALRAGPAPEPGGVTLLLLAADQVGGVPAGHEIVYVLLASAVIIGLFAPVTAWLYHRRGAPGGGTERAPTTTSITPIPGTSADS
jgi:hypothetical protein